MSDFFRPETTPVARKQHRCIGCYAAIPTGERYSRQTGVYDGAWFENKLHLECAQSLSDDADGGWYEFTPGECGVPERRTPPELPQESSGS